INDVEQSAAWKERGHLPVLDPSLRHGPIHNAHLVTPQRCADRFGPYRGGPAETPECLQDDGDHAGFIPYRRPTICGSAPKRTHAAAIIETRRAAGIMKQQPATMRPNQPLFRKPMNMASFGRPWSRNEVGCAFRPEHPADHQANPTALLG